MGYPRIHRAPNGLRRGRATSGCRSGHLEDRPRRGFTLVEVLVALVILSVAMLALAQLQFSSQRAATTSFQRTLAEVQALDMAERIWLDLRDPFAHVDAWRDANAGRFPGWSGEVAPVDGDPDLLRIRIAWDDPSPTGGGFDHFVRVPRVDD